MHRNAYLSQKLELYDIHEKAKQYPKEIADSRLDGMTRTNSMFLSVGRDYTFPNPLGHKMEGNIKTTIGANIYYTRFKILKVVLILQYICYFWN